MRVEGREGMGNEFPFRTIEQRIEPLRTEHWDGYEARVQLEVDGTVFEGYGTTSSNDALEALHRARWEAVRDRFPQLRDVCLPDIRQVEQKGK